MRAKSLEAADKKAFFPKLWRRKILFQHGNIVEFAKNCSCPAADKKCNIICARIKKKYVQGVFDMKLLPAQFCQDMQIKSKYANEGGVTSTQNMHKCAIRVFAIFLHTNSYRVRRCAFLIHPVEKKNVIAGLCVPRGESP